MPADNDNEETGSREALSRELERLEQIVSNNGFSREQKETFLGRLKEMEQLLCDENSQRASQDGPHKPIGVLWEQVVPKAQSDESEPNRISLQKSNDPRETALSWIPQFSAIAFLVALLGIIASVIIAILIKNAWPVSLAPILLLGTKPFRQIVNYLYPSNKKQTEALDEKSNESSPLSQVMSPLTQFIEKINGSEKK